MKCIVHDCDDVQFSRSLCVGHYQALRNQQNARSHAKKATPFGDAPTFDGPIRQPAGRVCECGKFLSTYNDSTMCDSCQISAVRWQDFAACNGVDPEVFFPRRNDNDARLSAESICAGCSVAGECLEVAIHQKEQMGIWGGMTRHERLRIQKSRLAGVS